MSRVSILEQLTAPKKRTALDFHYEDLWAPPIMSLFTPQDIQELVKIATSLRYAGNIARKYDMIDAVMKRRGFRRAHCGTNRVVYNFLEDDRFVAKVAVDRVGMEDSPAEYRNQAYFQPFCCKIFEVDPSGVISFIERVNPISSIEEFMSVKDDIFNMMVTKIIGKYIVDDLGTKAFMNFGIRMNANGTAFGPVIIDFPYAYELDGAKLRCAHKIINEHGNLEECGGEIDYDPGFNTLICNKCGREYKALDLAKEKNEDIKLVYTDAEKAFAKSIRHLVRGKIIDGDKVIYDSGRRSNRILLKEEFNSMNNASLPVGPVTVDKTIRKKNPGFKETKRRYYTDLQMQYYDKLVKAGMFNPVVEDDTMVSTVNEVITPIKSEDSEGETPIMGKAVTVSSVIADGSIIYSSEDIETLEENTFPELNNTPVDVTPPFTVDSDSKDTASASVIMPSENLPDQIITDEEVRRMVIEVKAASNTDNNVVDTNSSIIDPEKDKIPEISPITRPTSDPSNSVLYKEPKNTTSTIHLGPVSAVYEADDGSDDEGDDADIVKAITDAMVECSKSPSEEFRIGDDEEDLDTIDDYYDDAYDDTYDDYYDDARNKKHRNPMSY